MHLKINLADDPVDLWKWNRTQVSCDVTSWRYQKPDGAYGLNFTYATNVTFPDANQTEVQQYNI